MKRYRTVLEAIYRLYAHSGFTMAGAVAFSFVVSLFPFCIFLGALAGIFGGRKLADRGCYAALPGPAAAGRRRHRAAGGFDHEPHAHRPLDRERGASAVLRHQRHRDPAGRAQWRLSRYRDAALPRVAYSAARCSSSSAQSPCSCLRGRSSSAPCSRIATSRTSRRRFCAARGSRRPCATPSPAPSWRSSSTRSTCGSPRAKRTLKDVWPGVLLSICLWLALASLYSYYLNFSDYTRFYAGLSQLMVALIFFQMSAVIMILGAELNRGIFELKRLGPQRDRALR